MESNITDQQYLNDELQLPEPHFDEEATVLSARPVVPLEEIKARASIGRRLAFGLTILGSLLVGALGASLIYKQRGQKPAMTIMDTVVAGSAASAEGSPVIESSTGEARKAIAQSEAPNAGAVAEDKNPELQIAQRAERSEPQTRRIELARHDKESLTTSHAAEKEMRRAEKIEARRLRRTTERESENEARSRRRKSSDDLLRIREIFEGSPRP
jgi:hypothetical protein